MRPDLDYLNDDEYLYDDVDSQNAVSETQSPQRQEARSKTELGRHDESTIRSADIIEVYGMTDHQEHIKSSTESTTRTSNEYTFTRERGVTEEPRGDRSIQDEGKPGQYYRRDTAEPSEEGLNEVNKAASLEHDESQWDILNDRNLDHHENGYRSSTETEADYGSTQHTKGHKLRQQAPDMEGDYHGGGYMNQNGHSGSGEILPYIHADSREEEDEHYPREAFFFSEEQDDDEHRQQHSHHHQYKRPYYYYPGYREPLTPHYDKEVSEILRLVKEIHSWHFNEINNRGGYNRRKSYRSSHRFPRFSSHSG